MDDSIGRNAGTRMRLGTDLCDGEDGQWAGKRVNGWECGAKSESGKVGCGKNTSRRAETTSCSMFVIGRSHRLHEIGASAASRVAGGDETLVVSVTSGELIRTLQVGNQSKQCNVIGNLDLATWRSRCSLDNGFVDLGSGAPKELGRLETLLPMPCVRLSCFPQLGTFFRLLS